MPISVRNLLPLLALACGLSPAAAQNCEEEFGPLVPSHFAASQAVFVGRVESLEIGELYGDGFARLAMVRVEKAFKGVQPGQELPVRLPRSLVWNAEPLLVFARHPEYSYWSRGGRRPFAAEQAEHARWAAQGSHEESAWRHIEWRRSLDLRIQRWNWLRGQESLTATPYCRPWAFEQAVVPELVQQVEAMVAAPEGTTLRLQVGATAIGTSQVFAKLVPAGTDGQVKVRGPATKSKDSGNRPAWTHPNDLLGSMVWPPAPLDASLRWLSWDAGQPTAAEFPVALPRGTHRLEWPRLPGFVQNCFERHQRVDCDVLSVPERGLITRRVQYEPSGVLRIRLLDEQGRMSQATHLLRIRSLSPAPSSLPFEVPPQTLVVPPVLSSSFTEREASLRESYPVNIVPMPVPTPFLDVEPRVGDIRLLPGRYALDWWQVRPEPAVWLTSDGRRRMAGAVALPAADGQALEVEIRPGVNDLPLRLPAQLQKAELQLQVPGCKTGSLKLALMGAEREGEPLQSFHIPSVSFARVAPSFCDASVPAFAGQVFQVTAADERTGQGLQVEFHLEPGPNKMHLRFPSKH